MEYAEEKLECTQILIFFDKNRGDRGDYFDSLKFIIFNV